MKLDFECGLAAPHIHKVICIMGICGLMKRLEVYMEKAHIRDLAHCSVAVDCKAWIYIGARSCAKELAHNRSTDKYLSYFIQRLELLLSYGLIPTMVFDGGSLRAKQEESLERARKRIFRLDQGFLSEYSNFRKARTHFKHALWVSSDMIYAAIQELKIRNVKYVVAPHEADAQLAFLCRKGKVDAVFSDDADMLPYGCKRVFRNLDLRGNCREFKYDNLARFNELSRRKGRSKSLDLSEFTSDMIITMCVFSGCDYLKHVKELNIGRAYQLVKDWKDNYVDAMEAAKGSGIIFPENYRDNFRRAVKTYKHQVVYDPESETTVHLSKCSEDEEDLAYLGELLPQGVAKGIATGIINPYTRLAYGVRPATSGQEQVVDSGLAKGKDLIAKEEKEIKPLGKGLSGALQLLRRQGVLEVTDRDIDKKKKSKVVGTVNENDDKEIHIKRRDEYRKVVENHLGVKRKSEPGKMVVPPKKPKTRIWLD